jgi:hypothetical protein
MNDQTATLRRRTAIAGIAAGLLLSVSVAAELAHPVERAGRVVDLPLSIAYLLLYGAGATALAVALLSLRRLHRSCGRPLTRAGRAGYRTALAGSALQVVFAAVAIVLEAVTRKSPDAAFAFFGIGFLLLIAGNVMLALALRRSGLVGGSWALPLIAAAGGVVAIVAAADPYHDIGLFVFFSSWLGLGLRAMPRWPRSPGAASIDGRASARSRA